MWRSGRPFDSFGSLHDHVEPTSGGLVLNSQIADRLSISSLGAKAVRRKMRIQFERISRWSRLDEVCPDSIDQRGQLQICAASSLEKMPQHPAVEGQDQKKKIVKWRVTFKGTALMNISLQKMNLVISAGGEPRIRHGLANHVKRIQLNFKWLARFLTNSNL